MPEISEILVHPEAWLEASDASRDAYERRAKDIGVYLSAATQSGAGGKDVVVIVRDGAFVLESFTLATRCPLGRQAWEHVVRRALGLADPCF